MLLPNTECSRALRLIILCDRLRPWHRQAVAAVELRRKPAKKSTNSNTFCRNSNTFSTARFPSHHLWPPRGGFQLTAVQPDEIVDDVVQLVDCGSICKIGGRRRPLRQAEAVGRALRKKAEGRRDRVCAVGNGTSGSWQDTGAHSGLRPNAHMQEATAGTWKYYVSMQRPVRSTTHPRLGGPDGCRRLNQTGRQP